jgi:hypothetical protein
MTTAQKIISSNSFETFAEAQKAENVIRELAVKTTGSNCYNRAWYFYDGSIIIKTREGYKAV